MGFFRKKDGGKDYSFQEWDELETGWGKSKYVGRSIKEIFGIILFIYIFISCFFIGF